MLTNWGCLVSFLGEFITFWGRFLMDIAITSQEKASQWIVSSLSIWKPARNISLKTFSYQERSGGVWCDGLWGRKAVWASASPGWWMNTKICSKKVKWNHKSATFTIISHICSWNMVLLNQNLNKKFLKIFPAGAAEAWWFFTRSAAGDRGKSPRQKGSTSSSSSSSSSSLWAASIIGKCPCQKVWS